MKDERYDMRWKTKRNGECSRRGNFFFHLVWEKSEKRKPVAGTDSEKESKK